MAVTLEQMCKIVDNFVSDGTCSQFESSGTFWESLGKEPSMAQMYTECLIYKYIALTYGLGHRPLFSILSQIKCISAPGSPHSSVTSPDSTPSSSPRGSLSSAGSTKRQNGGGGDASEAKSTPKRKYNISRRRSEDSKKGSKKELKLENLDSSGRRKSKSMSKSAPTPEPADPVEKRDYSFQHKCENIILSLAYVSKMCDLTRWDFTKLREVFLTWNKARGWEQKASDYEYAIMKNFSMAPPATTPCDDSQNAKAVEDILGSIKKAIGEMAISNNRNVGESLKYWEIRHKILTRPEEATSVVKCLILVAKKVLDDGDESKILPLLHIFCEAIIMSPHTPLELLQECYSTFEMFYVWPKFVARPVKEVLDMIQFEMKCPGHFFRMIYFQDNEVPMASHLSAKMPVAETHLFVDQSIPDTTALSEALDKLNESRKAKMSKDTEAMSYVIRHIFESVYGAECCDLNTVDQALQATPEDAIPALCYDAMSIMERSATMKTHTEAQDFLRSELEIFSEKIVDFLEAESEKELAAATPDSDKEGALPKLSNPRRVSVLYDSCRQRDPSSPSRASAMGTPSPRRNNSYLRRTSSATLDNPKAARKISSSASLPQQECPADLLGTNFTVHNYDHKELEETVFDLVRQTAKSFVQEKKRSGRMSFSRKRRSETVQDTFRDSGVIDDDPNTGESPRLSRALQHLRIDESAEEAPAKTGQTDIHPRQKAIASTSSSTDESDISFAKLAENDDSDSFWKEFSENGFSGSESGLEELLNSMTLNQRKSFLLENQAKKRKTSSAEQAEEHTVEEVKTSATVETTSTVRIDFTLSQEKATEHATPVLRRSLKSDMKKMNRLSRFVRHKKRSTKKIKPTRDPVGDKVSSAESLSSVSSTPSSTTSEESSDQPIPRFRTTSDPVYKQRKRGKWATVHHPSSSPQVFKSRRDQLSVDVTPRSPFNMSVRSLPGRERLNILSGEAFAEGRMASPVPENEIQNCDECRTPKDSYLHPLSPSEASDHGWEQQQSPVDEGTTNTVRKCDTSIDDDEDSRRRIDSGIGPENRSGVRRRTMSAYTAPAEQEDIGIAGVKFVSRETFKVSRRSRMSVSDFENRMVQKKVLKLVFVGNDKTVGHMARAYYDLRRRQMSRAPYFQHIDLCLYFIPISSNQPSTDSSKPPPCDVRIGELIGTFDMWYHTIVMLSVNNLLRVYPKVFSYSHSAGDVANLSLSQRAKLLTPQELIASSLLSYCRFAVSKTNVNMYKVVMVTCTGEVLTDIFCFRLQAGHEAYTMAVKAGRFGKLGKLVDLSEDNAPPAAYTKIEYSKWSIDGQLVYTGKLDDTFYHTVGITPMSLLNETYRGCDVLNLFVIDNEKKIKNARKGSNRPTALEEVESGGDTYRIGTMKMEVMRPTQGTFSLLLDETKIYTGIKSIEVVPCDAPETETMRQKKRNASRNMTEQHTMRLPIRTFWPATH